MLQINLSDVQEASYAASCDEADLHLGLYLTHLLAREPAGRVSDRMDYSRGSRLLSIAPDTACLHTACTSTSRLSSIQTMWPNILHIVPETTGDSWDTFSNRTSPPPLQFPIEFSIQSQTCKSVGLIFDH